MVFMSPKDKAIAEGLSDAAGGPIEPFQCSSCGEWMYFEGAHGRCDVCEKEYPCSHCDPEGSLRAAVGRILKRRCSWEEKWSRSFRAYWDSSVARWITWRPPGNDFQQEVEDFVALLDRERVR